MTKHVLCWLCRWLRIIMFLHAFLSIKKNRRTGEHESTLTNDRWRLYIRKWLYWEGTIKSIMWNLSFANWANNKKWILKNLYPRRAIEPTYRNVVSGFLVHFTSSCSALGSNICSDLAWVVTSSPRFTNSKPLLKLCIGFLSDIV